MTRRIARLLQIISPFYLLALPAAGQGVSAPQGDLPSGAARSDCLGQPTPCNGQPATAPAVAVGAQSGLPPGWRAMGSRPQDYDFGTAPAPGASGQAAYIKGKPGLYQCGPWGGGGASSLSPPWGGGGAVSLSPPDCMFPRFRETPGGFGMLTQCIRADDYLGGRVRLSARLKSVRAANVKLWLSVHEPADIAALVWDATNVKRWLSGHGPWQAAASFYDMNDRPLRGTVDWQRKEIVLEVPDGSSTICYGFRLTSGLGEAWADDFSLTIVSNETPLTRPVQLKPWPVSPAAANLDFEGKGGDVPEGWFFEATPQARYRTGVEKLSGGDGNSVYIQARRRCVPMCGRWDGQGGVLAQRFSAESYRGKRLRLSTRLQTQGAGGAGCSMGVWKITPPSNTPVAGARGARLSDTQDWTSCSVVADVPADADFIRINLHLWGRGTVWSEGFRLETVGPEVAVTDLPATAAPAPTNLRFDQ